MFSVEFNYYVDYYFGTAIIVHTRTTYKYRATEKTGNQSSISPENLVDHGRQYALVQAVQLFLYVQQEHTILQMRSLFMNCILCFNVIHKHMSTESTFRYFIVYTLSVQRNQKINPQNRQNIANHLRVRLSHCLYHLCCL